MRKQRKKDKKISARAKKLNDIRNRSKLYQDRSKRLNRMKVKGEVWFEKLLIEHGYKEVSNRLPSDKLTKLKYKYCRNIPLSYFIFDFAIFKKNILIEIDGSYHKRESQQARDERKNDYAKKHGYKLIRIEDFNQKQALKALEVIKKSPNVKNKPPRKPKRRYVDIRRYHYKSQVKDGTSVSADELERIKNLELPKEKPPCPF